MCKSLASRQACRLTLQFVMHAGRSHVGTWLSNAALQHQHKRPCPHSEHHTQAPAAAPGSLRRSGDRGAPAEAAEPQRQWRGWQQWPNHHQWPGALAIAVWQSATRNLHVLRYALRLFRASET